MLLVSCETTGPAIDQDTICAGWKAHRFDLPSIAGLTDRDAGAILAHNKFGRSIGCW